MKPRKPLPRSTKPIKRSRLPSRTRKVRTKPRKGMCRPYLDWLKTQPCAVCGKRTGEWARRYTDSGGYLDVVLVYVDPAHVRKRNHCHGDLYQALPLARHLHNEQEGNNAKFEAKYGISLAALATEYTERWLSTADGVAWQAEHPQ